MGDGWVGRQSVVSIWRWLAWPVVVAGGMGGSSAEPVTSLRSRGCARRKEGMSAQPRDCQRARTSASRAVAASESNHGAPWIRNRLTRSASDPRRRPRPRPNNDERREAKGRGRRPLARGPCGSVAGPCPSPSGRPSVAGLEGGPNEFAAARVDPHKLASKRGGLCLPKHRVNPPASRSTHVDVACPKRRAKRATRHHVKSLGTPFRSKWQNQRDIPKG